ncbi:MAG: hypothetical protein KAW01_08830, partial [Deltaproteobacteria bacterium]|nr:hypothetical protein [Deltaproteobacteria bacterium]
MKEYLNLWEQRFPPGSTILTIGNFDGVHLGHQAIISRTVALAKKL